MIGRLNHVAIAVPDLEAAARRTATRWAPSRRSRISRSMASDGLRRTPEHQDRAAGRARPGLADPAFLDRNPAGGIHHLCYEVEDIRAAATTSRPGARVLGNGEPKIGAHGKPVLFLHPRTSTARFSSSSRHDRRRHQPQSAVAIFLVVWWLVFLMALPFGAQPEERPMVGNEPGRRRGRGSWPRSWSRRSSRSSSPGASLGSSAAATSSSTHRAGPARRRRSAGF